MYFEEKCYGITCDNCGVVYEESSTGYCTYVSKDNLHPEEDGWHCEEEIHYCKECHTIDDDDNIVIKKRPPVYLVIANFPNNKDFPIGKRIEFTPWKSSNAYWEHIVEDCQVRRSWLSHYFEEFPHLFKKVF